MGAFHIINFGCRATQADGAAIERELLDRGLVRSDEKTAAVVILNTCTVTASADADARAAVRRVHRENPRAGIVVTGCYAQRAPEEIASLVGVAHVVGNSHKASVATIAASIVGGRGVTTDGTPAPSTAQLESQAVPERHRAFVSMGEIGMAEMADDPAPMLVGDIFAHSEVLAAPVFDGDGSAAGIHARTRANLKVQDGCNNRCSFCIIPFVRGKSRSLAVEKVVFEAEQLVRAGFKEIVLSGINLGRWGRDLDRPDRFANLVRYVLNQTEVAKLRISSVEPMDWTEELIALVASERRIAKHAHVPLQSGSDRVLRSMHRKYRPWHYEAQILKLRAAMPDAALGADVMVGFPGETDELFRETYDFVAQLPLTYLHVFTFSARPGTPAAVMPEQVPVHVARERNRQLRELIAKKNCAFRQQFVGKRLNAIFLGRHDGAQTEALSDNFIKVRIDGEHPANEWHEVAITGLSNDGLVGECAAKFSVQ